MKQKKQVVQFALDKFTKTNCNSGHLKYIVKGYTRKGDILYFDEGDNEDGFGDFIKELEITKSAALFIPENSLQATLEFLNELKHSIENARLTLIFNNKRCWKKIVFTF